MFQAPPGTEKGTRDDSPIRVSTQAVAKAQAAQTMKLAPHQAKPGEHDAKPEGGVYRRKDKSSLSDEEMDDNSAFQLELSHEERNLEDKEMEMSDMTLCEAAAQTEEAAAKAAKTALTPTGAGEGNMPPPHHYQATRGSILLDSPLTYCSTQGPM